MFVLHTTKVGIRNCLRDKSSSIGIFFEGNRNKLSGPGKTEESECTKDSECREKMRRRRRSTEWGEVVSFF